MDETLLKPEVHDAMEQARRAAERKARSGLPVAPFAVLPGEVVWFAGGAAAETAAEYWSQTGQEYIVFCFASTLVHAGSLQPALMFRCRQRSDDRWHVYVQLYQPKRVLRPYRRIGELTLRSIEADAPQPKILRQT